MSNMKRIYEQCQEMVEDFVDNDLDREISEELWCSIQSLRSYRKLTRESRDLQNKVYFDALALRYQIRSVQLVFELGLFNHQCQA